MYFLIHLLFMVMGTKPRVLKLLNKHSATKAPHSPHPPFLHHCHDDVLHMLLVDNGQLNFSFVILVHLYSNRFIY